MWQLEKEFTFEAAHRLPYHDGKCARLHGHSYRMKIIIAASMLQESGPKTAMVQDFSEIKAVVKPLIDQYLDHHYLNDTLGTDTTTAEFIARWVYDQVKPALPLLQGVLIYETCTSACLYSLGDALPIGGGL